MQYDKLKEQYDQLIALGIDPTEYFTDDAIAAIKKGIPYSPNTSKAKARFSIAANNAARAADAADTAADVVGNAGKTRGKFFKEDGFFGKEGGLGGIISNVGNPQFDYNWKPTKGADGKWSGSGIQGWGKNLGGVYNVANLGMQGLNAIQGMQELSDSRDSMDDVISDIILGAGNSPTIMYDLNASQRDLLRELQRGDYDTTVNTDDINLLGALGDTAMGALSGLPGGLPGVIIGGVGGLTNSVIGDLNAGSDRRAAELEALYQAVLESEQYHNNMRKQRAYASLY